MGSDNLATFHDWRRWQAIAARIPIAVINRPGATLLSPRFARAAIAMAPYRVRDPDIAGLVRMDPPAWAFIAAPRTGESSTRLRSAGRNPLR